jgi:transposase
MLAMVEDQLDTIERRIHEWAEGDASGRLLMTVPGVGPVVALEFMATVDDPSRFGGAHLLESYLGLVPRLHTSGGPGQGGHLSKRGPSYLRTLLYQAAWGLLRSRDPKAGALQAWANALAQRRPPKVVVSALARRLAGVLLAIWRDGKPFEQRAPCEKPPVVGGKPLVRRYSLTKARAAAAAR